MLSRQGRTLPGRPWRFRGHHRARRPESANDVNSKPYLRRELDWIERHVADDHRFLGICLGGQMLARALGARSKPPDEIDEMGYYPVHPTPSGAELIPVGLHVYHWHKEGFEFPAGAELLARGEAFPHQAYRYGSKIYGLPFNAEVTAGRRLDLEQVDGGPRDPTWRAGRRAADERRCPLRPAAP